MVLESIGVPKKFSSNPVVFICFVFLVVSLSILAATYMDEKNSSILTLSLIVIAFVPMIHQRFIRAEREEIEDKDFVHNFFSRHKDLIGIYFMLFVGVIISYAFWYPVLPQKYHIVFSEQKNTLNMVADIKQTLTGNFSANQGPCGADAGCWRSFIFSHNLGVMLLFVVLSFLYGAGALYLVVWNASTLGVLIGQEITKKISEGIHLGVWHGFLSFLGLIGHGLPEAGAYFLGAIAGGILSVAIVSPKYGRKDIKIIFFDILFVLIIAILLLWIGASIEAQSIVAYAVK